MYNKIKNYFSLIKFSHTIFALPFAIIGFFLGLRESTNDFSIELLGLIVLCMVFARNTAMAFNRYIDRNIDAANIRTLNREIPSKKIPLNAVIIFICVNALLFIFCTFFINKLCFYLSPLALFTVLIYSYTKRITVFSHFFLGLALSLAPIGAYIAVCGQFGLTPLLISLSVLFWVSGFDIIYALQDMEFDKKNNLKSIPALIGYNKARYAAIITHIVSLTLLTISYLLIKSESYFIFVGLFVFSIFIVFQHILIALYGLKKINTAFFSLNGLASIVLAVFTCIELYFF